jgi:predicted acyltransferase
LANPSDSSPSRRADALDALRGFAILTMALQGMLYAYGLPAWMYHAQKPPPDYTFDPTVAGLTWVDLVFPFFLFTMGAAMPLALAGRIARGAPGWQLAAYAVRRGVLLLGFALYVQHIVPWSFEIDGKISAARWLWSLLAFAVLFPALMRLPWGWLSWRTWLPRAVGWGAAILIMATVRFPDGSGFSLERADIIIVVLAHTVTVGSLLWLVSRNNLPLRLGFMLTVLAIILGAEGDGWLRQMWHVITPQRSLLLAGYLKYLLIVLPGTIAGDLLLSWLGGHHDESATTPPWSPTRFLRIAVLMLALCVLTCCGLQARWVAQTTFIAFAACAAGFVLFEGPRTSLEVLLRRLYGWGVLWLVIGLLVEPYEGGIRKDHATLSYYFVTSGLAVFALIFFSVIIDGLGRRGWLRLLIDSGQNPMIAYVGIRNLLPPLLGLLAIEQLVGRLELSPWAGFGWACVKTVLLAAAVSVFTRVRVFWRT